MQDVYEKKYNFLCIAAYSSCFLCHFSDNGRENSPVSCLITRILMVGIRQIF